MSETLVVDAPPSPPATDGTRPSRSRRNKLSCPKCSKAFTRAEHLKRHIRAHTKEKPFVCPDCGKEYNRCDVLIRHRRTTPNHTMPTPARSLGSAVLVHTADTTPSMHSHDTSREGDPGFTGTLRSIDEQEGNMEELIPFTPINATVPRNPADFGTGDTGYDPTFMVSHDGPNSTQVDDTSMLQNDWHVPDGSSMISNFTANNNFSLWRLDDILHADLFETFMPQNTLDATPSHFNHIREKKVQDIWFFGSPSDDTISDQESHSGLTTRVSSPQPSPVEVGEHHRSRLQRRLQIHPFEPYIPSTDFLNACIRLYFSRAHALLPIIHPATWRPSKANGPLTLAICIIGSTLMGSEESFNMGVRLFERHYKATLLYWERARANGGNELVSTIQAAVLCQLFALLSGRPNLLLTADSFHGPPVSWARYKGLFRKQKVVQPVPGLSDDELDRAWREWAGNEESTRTAQALGIIDAELAVLLHHEPIMRLNCQTLTPCSSDKLFMARSAREWWSRYIMEYPEISNRRDDLLSGISVLSLDMSIIPGSSTLTACAILEELHLCIAAFKTDQSIALHTMPIVHNQLLQFYHHIVSRMPMEASMTKGLLILWHSVFITMFTDMILLEKAIGRDGAAIDADQAMRTTIWADSRDAQRAVAHALLIGKLVESLTVLDEVAVHVPRSLFYAGVVLFCYGKFISAQGRAIAPVAHDSIPEIKLLRHNVGSWLLEAQNSPPGAPMYQKSLYVITQLLQRIGSWGTSRRFGDILGTVTTTELGRLRIVADQ